MLIVRITTFLSHTLFVICATATASWAFSTSYGHIIDTAGRPNAAANFTEESTAEYFYANFQIVEVKNDAAKAYLDVQGLIKNSENKKKLNEFLRTAEGKFSEIVPFFTDKPVSKISILIINITNIDEYNQGSGYTKIGEAELERIDSKWKFSKIDIKEPQ